MRLFFSLAVRNNEAKGLGKSYPTTLNNVGSCWPTIKKLTWSNSFRQVTVFKNFLSGISKTNPVNLPSAAAANCCVRLHKVSKFHVSWRTKTSDVKDWGEIFFLFLNLINLRRSPRNQLQGNSPTFDFFSELK